MTSDGLMGHIKLALVSSVGMVVTMTGLENATKIAIAVATLAYVSAQATKTWMEVAEKRRKKNAEKNDEKND